MSSTGQALGYVIGAVAGYFTGGASYVLMGAAIGGAVGSAIDPPKGPKITGPRLSDLSQQSSAYGAPIPRVYGSVAALGNIFWIENNALKEQSKTEGGGKGGGGGAETTTYAYSATFAVGLCEGPIVGVRRIWAMGKLIYDAGTDDVSMLLTNNKVAGRWKLYTGTETQQPDPRMQSDIGVANCPAYRGLAYLVFYDFELAEYGNSLMGAQIKVEVMTAAADDAVSVVQTTVLPGAPQTYKATALNCDSDGTLHIYRCLAGLGSIGDITVTDYLPAANLAIPQESAASPLSGGFVQGWSDKNECIQMHEGTGDFYMTVGVQPIFIGNSQNARTVGFQQFSFYRRDDRLVVCANLSPSALIQVTNLGALSESAAITSTPADPDGLLHDVFLGADLNYGVTLKPALICYDLDWAKLWSVDMTGQFAITNGIGSSDGIIREKSDGEVVIRVDDKFWIVNSAGYTYLGEAVSASLSGYESHGGDHLLWPMWLRYDAQTNRVFSVKLDGLRNVSVPLSTIVETECLKSAILTAGDLQMTGLTDSVRGYRITSVAAIRSGIEPLQGAYPFDVMQAGYKIHFKRRGAASSVATIPLSDLVRSGESGRGDLITMPREMDTQLPWRVSVNHLDYDREYDAGEQYAERLNTKSVNISSLEIPVVMTGNEAARVAETLLYLYWLERVTARFKLPPTYRALEPCDTVTVDAFGGALVLRIKDVTYESDGSLEVSAVQSGNSIYSSAAVGGVASVVKAPVTIQGPSALALLDIPLLRDQDNLAGFPVAMAGYTTGWRGATLFRSEDGGQSWTGIASSITAAVMGVGTSPLPVPATTALFDEANLLPVYLYAGSLASVSEAQLFGGANHFAYGRDGRWEIIAARNCVLQGDGSYLLSGLLRGRFGSEAAMSGHVANDMVVLLSEQSLQFIGSNVNALGVAKSYQAVTFGYGLGVAAVPMTYRGVNLKCLSPVYLNGSRHPSTADWSLTWLRRTRIGGEWRDGVDATLGEASEAYEIDIFSSGTYTTIKRTISGLSSAAASYTSAQQVSDFGSNQTTLYLKIYQISATTGRGSALTTSITR